MLKHSDALVFPSRLFLDRAVSKYPILAEKRLFVVPHGIELSFVQGPRRATPDTLRVSVFGRLLEEKGAGRIEAIVGESSPETAFTWFGVDARKRAQLRWHDRLAGVDRLRLEPPAQPNELVARLDQTDVVLVPSCFDTFALIALEGASRGAPCVVSLESGVSELVRDFGGGLVADFGRPREVAGALDTIRRDYEQFSAAAIALATQFDARRMLSTYEHIYANTAG